MTPTFRGVNHFALSVTDLDRSTTFYTEVFQLVTVLDFGHGRVCLDRATGFSVGLIQHRDKISAPFSELNPGLDHLGMTATDRDELVAWTTRFDALGVVHSPIRDTAFGHHLNFRDPDNIALEMNAPTQAFTELIDQLRSGTVPDSVLLDRAEDALGPGLVVRT